MFRVRLRVCRTLPPLHVPSTSAFVSPRALVVRHTSAKKAGDDGPDEVRKKYTWYGKEKVDDFHYSDRPSGSGYSNFANTIYPNRPYKLPHVHRLQRQSIYIGVVLLLILVIDDDWLIEVAPGMMGRFKPEASEIKPSEESKGVVETDEAEQKPEKKKKKKIGFRDRRIIEYENRIRSYSTPDKIFRYFATLKVVNEDDPSGRTFEVFMTPQDFVRALTPGVMQPRRLGLDSYKVYQPNKYHHKFSNPKSIFYKLGENGLISFSDYLFLIFDVNGDGALDRDEFRRVRELVMSQTTVGQRHRDHVTLNTSFKVENSSALEKYFFGHDGTEKLTAAKFLAFQARLHRDVLHLEFARRDATDEDSDDGTINEVSFAQMLLVHAAVSEKRQKIMLKRVRSAFKNGPGVTFKEVCDFFQFLYHIEAVDMALHFHRLAGTPVEGKELQRVARKVAGVPLSQHVIEIVIALFDENLDGKLSDDEFVSIMRRRMRRGLERPKDTGLVRLLDSVIACSRRLVPT